jgi:hypothetical protein
MHTSFRCALAAAGLLIALGGPARSQDSSIALVPAKAPIVVQMNGFEKARNRLGKFLGNALPDIAPKVVKQIDDGIKELAEGRDLKAISKDARLYLIITDLSNLFESPQVTVLIPVSGYAEFKESFLKADERKSLKKEDGVESVKVEGKDEPMYLVDRKDYVVVSVDRDVAKQFAKGDQGGLDKALSKETLKAFLDQDVSAYVNLKEINKQYGAQIRGFKALLELGLQGAPGMGIDKKQAEMVKQIFDGFLQILGDGVAAVIGLEFRPEGANLKLMAQFASDTETNAFLKKLKPASLVEISALPVGQLVYSASNFDPTLSKTLSSLLKEAMADDENEEIKKKIDEAMKELADNGRNLELAAGNIGAGSLEVSEYKDGAKAVASQLKLFKALAKTSTFQNLPLKSKPVIKEDAETVGSTKLHMIKLTFDFDKAVENLPEATREAAKTTMMKMAGGESSTIWFGAAGNKVVHVTTKDWKEARTFIENYLQGKNTLEKDESFQSTRKQLPAESTFVVVADTPRFLQVMVDMIKDQVAGLPGFPGGNIPELKVPKGKPAYFGLALTLKAEHASFDLFVPVTAVQQVRKMLAPLIDGDN